MKKCSKCNTEKDESEFSLHSPKAGDGKLRPDCKQCVTNRTKKYNKDDPQAARDRAQDLRKRNKNVVLDYLLSHPCVDCGEKDPIVLDFDHLDDKIDGISEMVFKCVSVDKILKEIEKCEVRCANCHRRKTFQRRNACLV